MPVHVGDAEPADSLASVLRDAASANQEIFVLPGTLDFSLWQRDTLGQLLAQARREHPGTSIHHDDIDLAHPLLIRAFAEQAALAIARRNDLPPATLRFDSCAQRPRRSRQPRQSYRLMRLIWEELALARAEVGFVRHVQPFLGHCPGSLRPRSNLKWLILPQALWRRACRLRRASSSIIFSVRIRKPRAGRSSIRPAAQPSITAWFAQTHHAPMAAKARARKLFAVQSAKTQSPPLSAAMDLRYGHDRASPRS